MTKQPIIRAFFDEPTNTVSYLVADPSDEEGRYHRSGARLRSQCRRRSTPAPSRPSYRRQTRPDFRSSGRWRPTLMPTIYPARPISRRRPAPRSASANTSRTFSGFSARSSMRPIWQTDGSDFDHLFKDGERFKIGELEAEVLYTPGHTPADISYKIEDAVFVGDTLFMPDYGTARADFPGGDAHQLYRSIKRLMALPPETRLFMCHDYKAPGREYMRGRPLSRSNARRTFM